MANSSFASATRRSAGFTLIEVMITVVIVAILAAIALPGYSDFVRRSKIVEATTQLGDMRTDMEKYFMDNRTYLNGAACGVDAKIAAHNLDPASNFTLSCPAPTATTYTLRADGIAAKGMGAFAYTVDQLNAKTTVTMGGGWAGAGKNCWVTRKDGSC